MCVTSPHITCRYAHNRAQWAGGAQGNEMRRLRAGRGAPADSVSGWAGRLLSGLRLPTLPVRPAMQSAAVPPRPATAQAVHGSTTRLSPGAPIAGRSPGRLQARPTSIQHRPRIAAVPRRWLATAQASPGAGARGDAPPAGGIPDGCQRVKDSTSGKPSLTRCPRVWWGTIRGDEPPRLDDPTTNR